MRFYTTNIKGHLKTKHGLIEKNQQQIIVNTDWCQQVSSILVKCIIIIISINLKLNTEIISEITEGALNNSTHRYKQIITNV